MALDRSSASSRESVVDPTQGKCVQIVSVPEPVAPGKIRHSRSPYLLRPRAPYHRELIAYLPETGILIPSVLVNHRLQRCANVVRTVRDSMYSLEAGDEVIFVISLA